MRDEAIAQVCHEANRVVQSLQADPGIPVAAPWVVFPADERAGVVAGVRAVREGAFPEVSHELWCRGKRVDGWRHGPVKDAAAKLHPCLVPYEALPPAQRAKDALFAAIVTALADAPEVPS